MRGPTRFTSRPCQREAPWILPQSAQSYSRAAITSSSDSPRVYKHRRASGSRSRRPPSLSGQSCRSIWMPRFTKYPSVPRASRSHTTQTMFTNRTRPRPSAGIAGSSFVPGFRDALVEFPKLRVLTPLEFAPLGLRQWRRKEIDSWCQDGPGPLALCQGNDPRKWPPSGRQDREALLGGHLEGARHASNQILLRLSRLRGWFRGKGHLPPLFGGHEVVIYGSCKSPSVE